MQRCNNHKKNTHKGFTLIEMMVSVSIFAIVLVVALGSILTILDSNRKARTLTEVMNNLNFSLETITRSVKTGVEPRIIGSTLEVVAIILAEDGFQRQTISYRKNNTDSGRGFIERSVNNGLWHPITSDLVHIESFIVTLHGVSAAGNIDDFSQPRTQVTISGEVEVSETISSAFTVQTTISQRKLNLEGSEQAPGDGI